MKNNLESSIENSLFTYVININPLYLENGWVSLSALQLEGVSVTLERHEVVVESPVYIPLVLPQTQPARSSRLGHNSPGVLHT